MTILTRLEKSTQDRTRHDFLSLHIYTYSIIHFFSTTNTIQLPIRDIRSHPSSIQVRLPHLIRQYSHATRTTLVHNSHKGRVIQ